MNSKTEKDKNKALQDKFQAILSQMLREEDNKFCVDCDSKGPRWASWNLGIFLCIRCAGIHRNLGVHVSRVKSVNLDSWTAEQVAMMKEMGNSRARAVYEANLPDNYRRPLTDSGLEVFIRQKYEEKKYIAREWIPPKLDVKSLQLDDIDVTPRGASANSKSRPRPVSTIETTQARPRLSIDSRQTSVTSGGTPAANPQQGQGHAAPTTDLLSSIDVASPSATAAAQNNSADLLGISFASSVNISNDNQQASAVGGQTQASAWPQPEVDLFGEGSSSEQQRKMDKDNIMKLYAATPAPMGAMYMMQQQQQMYGMNPVQAPMGMHQMAYGQPSPAMMGGWGGAMQAAPQRFDTLYQVHPTTMMPMHHPGGTVPVPTNYNFVPGTFGQPHYYQQTSAMPPAYGVQVSPVPLPNRYAVAPMTNGAMMPNQAPPYSAGHSLSTNLWQ